MAKFALITVLLVAAALVYSQDCQICEFFIGEIESYLEQGLNVTQVEEELEQYCSFFGSFAQQVA